MKICSVTSDKAMNLRNLVDFLPCSEGTILFLVLCTSGNKIVHAIVVSDEIHTPNTQKVVILISHILSDKFTFEERKIKSHPYQFLLLAFFVFLAPVFEYLLDSQDFLEHLLR